MFKENKAKSAHAEPTKWFDRAPWLTSYPSKWHNYKRGKSPMITIDNMHQGYIFRVWSVVLLVVQCYRFCWCSFCLLALLHIPSWGRGETDPNQSWFSVHLKKVSIQMNLKIPCTTCSDWRPSTMRMLIARFIALLLMLLLAKVKVDVFRVWPFSL